MTGALSGTVALVTGASSGIGAATARRLAAEGASVALVARRGDRLTDLAGKIEAEGGSALAVEADLTGRAVAEATVDHVVDRLGRLDTVVNNAGIMLVGPVAEAPAEEWERMLQINIQALLYVTKAALPHLTTAAASKPRRVADIVNISSTAGRVARPGNAVYSLTKFGVNAFTEALRQETLAARIRVGVVEPGTVATELTDHIRDELRDRTKQQTGSIEAMLPADIADAVAYMVTRDRRVAVNEMLVRAGEQTW